MATEMFIALLVLLSVVVYFWRISFKYVIVGGLLGLVSVVSYYYITVLLASDNIIPMPSFANTVDTTGQVYTSGILILMITYALISGALGVLVEMGLKAYEGIQATGTAHTAKKKKK